MYLARRYAFKQTPAFYHYISLAKKKLTIEETQNNAKSFLYAIRALLCANWIADTKTIPPVKFSELTNRYLQEGIREELHSVLDQKKLAKEKDNYKIPKNLWSFTQKLYEEVSTNEVKNNKPIEQQEYDKILKIILATPY